MSSGVHVERVQDPSTLSGGAGERRYGGRQCAFVDEGRGAAGRHLVLSGMGGRQNWREIEEERMIRAAGKAGGGGA